MRSISFSVIVAAACLVLAAIFTGWTTVGAQQAEGSSVVVVPLEYAYGKYYLSQEVTVLPCESPNRLDDEGEADSLVEIKGGEKEQTVLLSYRIKNPRIDVGFEDKDEHGLRDEGAFTLFFALQEGMQTVSFTEDPRQQGEPDITVELSDAISLYYEKGGSYKEAECQPPDSAFVPDALRGY